MRYFLILLLQLSLFANSYDFDEYKFVWAASAEFAKSGNIVFDGNKTIITYSKPKFKQIVTDGVNVSIQGASGKVFNLKGKAQYFTNLYILVMTKIDELDELVDNKDFDVNKQSNIYDIYFKGEIKEQILRAEVTTKDEKVISFKLFMKNDDTLEIVKR